MKDRAQIAYEAYAEAHPYKLSSWATLQPTVKGYWGAVAKALEPGVSDHTHDSVRPARTQTGEADCG